MMKRRRVKILIVVAALILVSVALYSGLQILESTVLQPDQVAVPTTPSKTVVRNDVAYFPRQDITVFMILGIDEEGPVKDSMSYNNNGEADVILLAVFDDADQSYSVLTLNRDTMLDIPVLGLGGKQAGTYRGQLALSHTYGGGLEDSCENTKKAVSDFLGGIQIDYYLSMNMDAVSIFNDAVGGVTVTVTDDFSDVDPSIQMGEFTLKGQQALNFVQIRKDVGSQMNVSRMERQKEYMDGFVKALNEKTAQSSSFVVETYEQVAPYIVSDCSVTTLSNLVNRFSQYSLKEIITPEGENVKGETFMEFYVDEQKLDEMILKLFFAEK